MSCSVALHTAAPLGINGGGNPRKSPAARDRRDVSRNQAHIRIERPTNFLVLVDSIDLGRWFGVPLGRAASTSFMENIRKINILSETPVTRMLPDRIRPSTFTAETENPRSHFSQYEGSNAAIEGANANRSHLRYMYEMPRCALPVSRVFPVPPARLGGMRSRPAESGRPRIEPAVLGS